MKSEPRKVLDTPAGALTLMHWRCTLADAHRTKTCRDCAQEKPIALFDPSSGNKDGYSGQCKDCRNAYYRANADRYKAHAKRYRTADPEAAKRKDRESRARSRDQRAAYAKRWREANKEHRQEYNRKWVRENLDYFRAKNAVRRVRIRQSAEHYTPADVKELFLLQRGKCACCREKLADYEVDHVQPLSKGGHNGRGNIQLLCRHCNRTKHDKDQIEFMQSRGLLL